jgi:hypothetical protein
MSGAGIVVALRGKEYRISPLRSIDFGEMEQYMLTHRVTPLDIVLDRASKIPKENLDKLLEIAYQDSKPMSKATPQELEDWIRTPIGQVYYVWLHIRRLQPDVSLENVRSLIALLDSEEIADLRNKLDRVSGFDQLRNSTGQAQEARTDGTGVSPGVASTAI